MRRRVGAAIVIVAIYLLTAAGLMSDFQHSVDLMYLYEPGRPDQRDCLFIRSRYRSNLGAALGLALFPPLWLVAPLVTGFYEHGVSLKMHEGCRT